MGNISHALIVTVFTISITISFTLINAQLHVSSSHSLPYTLPSPSHAPAPSPSHHPHHHHHHHHHHAHSPASPPQPSKPITPPPTKPPTTKPAYPPVKPPSKTPTPLVKRKFVAVEGMVYCKSNCTYAAINTLLGASPLPGASVVMRCRNTPYLLRKTAKTDSKGYFFLQAPPLITTYGAHKCKVYLAHKPKNGGPCTHAADLNGGASGAYLFSNNTGPPKHLRTFSLFTVGPFTYEPSKCYKH